MSQNKEIQLDEESKYDLELSVPSEIYKKEYKMIYIPSQSKILIENLDKKIKNNFIDLNSIEKNAQQLIQKLKSINKTCRHQHDYSVKMFLKMRDEEMIQDLKLKDVEYYTKEFKDFKEFPTAFKNTSEVYSKLGQYTETHQLDSSRPLQINKGTFPNGDEYIYYGQLEEGTDKWDGVGICVDSSGTIIEGCCKNGSLNCFGRSIYNNKDYYIGEFKGGNRNGHGTYWFADGSIYVGECKNNKWNGQGTINYTDGSKYVGEWKDDKFHGKGTKYFADGQIFREGVWADHKYVGKG